MADAVSPRVSSGSSVGGPAGRYQHAREVILDAAAHHSPDVATFGDQHVVLHGMRLGVIGNTQADIEPGTSIHTKATIGDTIALHHAPYPSWTRYTDSEVMVVQPKAGGTEPEVLANDQQWWIAEYDRGGKQTVDIATGAILAQTGSPYIEPEPHS